jgi:2-polyprenyl-3-methyl-5-hydroxy-6-metoxy-1,4-benzoquinol methylase
MEKQDALAHSLKALAGLDNYNGWIYGNISPFLGNSILEIGCGTGNITDYFIKPGRKITGMDISDEFVSIAKEKYRGNADISIIKGDALNPACSLAPGSFDTVVLLNVLEHIKDDSAALACIYNMLLPGGRAVILVPAMKFAFGGLDKELGHFKRYEKADMAGLFKAAGLKTEKLFYMNMPGALGWAINSRILGKRFIPEGQAGFVNKVLVPIIRPLEKIVPPLFGQSLIAVGIKP